MTPARAGATRASFSALLSALALAGCGGGLPLLHPARTLRPGAVRAAAGFSGSVATGDLASALRNAQSDASASAGAPGTDATYAKGALVAASIAPGLAPFAGARVGLGSDFEAGLTYTGRALRADARRSFELGDHLSLSIGAGASAALFGHQDGSALPNVDLGNLHGWGADVPVLVGYASDADVYLLWIGARGGWERIDIDDVRSEPKPAASGPPIGLSAERFWGGGLVGVAVGFRHVHVAMEIEACYASVTGDYSGIHTQVTGWALSPATALWWRF